MVQYHTNMQTFSITAYNVLYSMLQWLENDFLNYLDEWEKCIKNRKGFTPAQQTMMLLSPETLEGLRMTGNYICIG